MTGVNNNINSIKCCIVGSCGVGKTSIIKKKLDKNNKNTETTLGAIFWTLEHHPEDGPGFKIDFWDTAGQERYNALIPMYSRNSHIMIITFDISDKQSFTDLEKWLETISNYCEKSLFLLVGNKNDMELYRQVFQEDVDSFIHKYKNYKMKYFETSAKTGYNIEELFQHIYSLGSGIISRDKIKNRMKKLSDLKALSTGKENQTCCNII